MGISRCTLRVSCNELIGHNRRASQYGKAYFDLLPDGLGEVFRRLLRSVNDEVHLIGRHDEETSLLDDRIGISHLLPLN